MGEMQNKHSQQLRVPHEQNAALVSNLNTKVNIAAGIAAFAYLTKKDKKNK